jgi:hypothetical protein
MGKLFWLGLAAILAVASGSAFLVWRFGEGGPGTAPRGIAPSGADRADRTGPAVQSAPPPPASEAGPTTAWTERPPAPPGNPPAPRLPSAARTERGPAPSGGAGSGAQPGQDPASGQDQPGEGAPASAALDDEPKVPRPARRASSKDRLDRAQMRKAITPGAGAIQPAPGYASPGQAPVPAEEQDQ